MNLPIKSMVATATKAMATDYHKVMNSLRARDAKNKKLYTRVGNQLVKK